MRGEERRKGAEVRGEERRKGREGVVGLEREMEGEREREREREREMEGEGEYTHSILQEQSSSLLIRLISPSFSSPLSEDGCER